MVVTPLTMPFFGPALELGAINGASFLFSEPAELIEARTTFLLLLFGFFPVCLL